MKKFSINDKFLKTVSETVEHISTNRGPYICPNCNESFLEFREFNIHIKDQCSTSRKVYITYPSTNHGNSNKVLHLTVDQYFYGSCSGKKYKEKNLNKKFTCYSCQKVLRNNIRFMSHVRHKIENDWEENDSINDFNICNHCYRHYDSPFHLQCHLETVHTTVPAASTCRICELNFKTEDDLLQHMQNEHTYNEMPYICKLCSYRSSFYSDLMVHFRQVHENGRSMMCPFCLCIFQTPNSYLKHVLLHRKKNLRCNKCRLQFVQATDKNKHLSHDHSSVQSAAGKNCLPKRPSHYKINVEVSHHPMSPSKAQTAPRLLSCSKMQPLTSPPKFNATRPAQTVQSSQTSKRIYRDYTSYAPPNKFTLDTAVGPIVTELNICIRLTRGCENSRCFECGTKLGFYAYNYNKHFRKEYKCRQCQFVSHCPTATHKHILKFHSKSKSMHLKNLEKPVNNISPFAKLCARKHTSNEYRKKRKQSESPPTIPQETKKSSVKQSPPSASPPDNGEPPKKRRSKLNLDSMLEKAARQVALENMKYLNNATAAKQPRKQLLPKKFNLEQDAPLKRIETAELGATNKKTEETHSKPNQPSTAGSSAVQMPSPILKVKNPPVISEKPSPPPSTSPRHSKRLQAKSVSLNKNCEEANLSVEEGSNDSWKDASFTTALGLKQQGHNFLKKAVPPSMFNPYKFSSAKTKLSNSPQANLKQVKEFGLSKDGPKSTRPKSIHSKHKQQKVSRMNVLKPPLSPRLTQPPLPDLCFVKSSEGKILLSAKEGSNISNEYKDVPKPPTSMWFSDVTNSTFIVHWTPPSSCIVTHYNLVFKGIGLPTTQILPPEQTSVKLVGLRSSTDYMVQLSTRCKTLQSDNLEGMQTTKSLRDYRTPVKVSEFINLDDDDDDCQVIEIASTKHAQSAIDGLSELHGTPLTATAQSHDTPRKEALQQTDKPTTVPLETDIYKSQTPSVDDTSVLCIAGDIDSETMLKKSSIPNIDLTDEGKSDRTSCNKILKSERQPVTSNCRSKTPNLHFEIETHPIENLVMQCKKAIDRIFCDTDQNAQSAKLNVGASLASNRGNVFPMGDVLRNASIMETTPATKDPDNHDDRAIVGVKKDVGIPLMAVQCGEKVGASSNVNMEKPSSSCVAEPSTKPENPKCAVNSLELVDLVNNGYKLDGTPNKSAIDDPSTGSATEIKTNEPTATATPQNAEVDENVEKLKFLDECLAFLGERE